MRTIFIICCLMIAAGNSLQAQNKSSARNSAALGLGLGLPYGGIGGKLSYNPADQFTLFGGLGYNTAGAGVNAGFLYSIPSTTHAEFYFTGMYGYNAAINIKGLPDYRKSYYGASFGVGLKVNSLVKEGAYWDIALLVPLRSKNYRNAIDEIERNPMIDLRSKPWPVLFSAGYNFPLSSH